ncbi:MAG: addiction module protein [Dehalococcoidia bacterium]
MTRVEELLEQVKALSEDEQDEFRMLYEGVSDEPELSPEWQAEIRRRVEEVENGTARTRTWDEVKAALRARIDAAKG